MSKVSPLKSKRRAKAVATSLVFGAALVGFDPAALAEPAPRSLDRALTDLLALGDAAGCSTAFAIPVGTQEETELALRALREAGQLGRELTAVCGASAVNSAAALGGSLGSLQTTKTVSQFRLVRHRLDSRLDAQGKRSDLGRVIRLAALGEPLRPPMSDTATLESAPQSGFAVFGQAEYERRKRETTELEPGHKADISDALIGVDYATPNGFIVGAWAGYRNTDARYTGASLAFVNEQLAASADASLLAAICNVGPGGGFDDRGGRLGAFVGKRAGKAFADVAVQYSRRNYDYARNICAIETNVGAIAATDDIFAGTLSGRTRLTEWGASARAGYDFGSDRFLWGPRISITYLKSQLGAFTETGRTSVTNLVEGNIVAPVPPDPNPQRILSTTRAAGDPTGLELAFDKQSRTSLQSEMQLLVAYRFDTALGALIPRVSASWVHEFKAERRLITVRMAQDLRPTPVRFGFTTDRADEDKGLITIGLTALITEQFAADIEVARLVGDNRFDSTAVRVQARWRF